MEYWLVLRWWLVYAAMLAIGLPVAAALFGHVNGRGAGFAPTASLAALTLVAFWIGHLAFGRFAVGVAVMGVGGLALVALRHGADIDPAAAAEALVVFTAGFFLVVAVRALDPGIVPFHEHFLNYGLLNALLRADRLPPEDVWYAGEPVAYYYGGHLATAALALLTDTPARYAFNLALAGFYGLLVTAAYELGGAIGAGRGTPRRLAGSLAAVWVGIAGNLLVPVKAALGVLPASVGEPVGRALGARVDPAAAHELATGFGEFSYANSVHVIPDTINQFPLYAWLHGELHAHMTSAPFFLLAVGLCYAYYRLPNDAVGRRRLLLFAALPAVGGVVAVTNLWDLPTVLGVVGLTALAAPSRTEHALPAASAWVRTSIVERIGAPAVVGAGAALVAAPFLSSIAGGAAESVALVRPVDRSGLVGLLLVHGGFVLAFVTAIFGRIPRLDGRRVAAGIGVIVLAGGLAWAIRIPVLAVILPLITVAAWYVRDGRAAGFETLLLLAGAGLILLVEVAFLANQDYHIRGRGNTVFKAYVQVWALWGVGAGVMLARLATGFDGARPTRRRLGAVAVAGLTLTASLYGAVALYDHADRALAPPDETAEQADYVYAAFQRSGGAGSPTRPPTLDGHLYAQVRHPAEAEAIEWLGATVRGTPTMVTAPGGRWEWTSPAAAFTGIPTVAGWAHELVYREEDAYYARVDDVRRIYRGTDRERARLLAAYDVAYVYVGPVERSRYDVRPFDGLRGVSIAFENDAVTIYRVDRERLRTVPGG